MILRLIFVLLTVVAASPSFALTEEELRARLIASSKNVTDKERHEVAISNCRMRTFRWQKQNDGSWPIWTSFEFYMPDVLLTEQKDGRKFVAVPSQDDPEAHLALIIFRQKEGAIVTQEFPNERKMKHKSEPSPLGDGTTHRIRTISKQFLIVQTGADVIEKADIFTNAYEHYVRRYCFPTG